MKAQLRPANTYALTVNKGSTLCQPTCTICKELITPGQHYYAKPYCEVHKSCADGERCDIVRT